MSDQLPAPADLSYFILKSLESLSKSVSELQVSLTAMQVSLVSRTELKELRDHCDREFKLERERCDGEFEAERSERVKEDKELSDKVGQLQVRAGIAAFVIAAVVAWAVRKLGG